MKEEFLNTNLQHSTGICHMKSLTIVFLAGLSSLQLFSQSIITGTVTSNDFPIPGASVYIEGSYTGVSTNDNG